jgi:peroxiredoxin Q/BCP
MKMGSWLLAGTLLVGLLIVPMARAELKVGDPAPEFRLPGSDGKMYQLADFRGERAVVIAFFPKAFTGG